MLSIFQRMSQKSYLILKLLVMRISELSENMQILKSQVTTRGTGRYTSACRTYSLGGGRGTIPLVGGHARTPSCSLSILSWEG